MPCVQTCTPIDFPAHGHGKDGNFPSAVGIFVEPGADGAPAALRPVFANDAARYREAAVYIAAYKRCMGKSHAEVLAMEKGEAFINSTLRYDEDNWAGGEVGVEFVEVPTIADAAEDDKSRQLAYRVTYKRRGAVVLQADFTPEDFVEALIRVRRSRA